MDAPQSGMAAADVTLSKKEDVKPPGEMVFGHVPLPLPSRLADILEQAWRKAILPLGSCIYRAAGVDMR